jgi:TldD protein
VVAQSQRQPGQPARPPETHRYAPGVSAGDSKAAGLIALEGELRRAMSELRRSQEIPPYYIGYEVHDRHDITISASDGALTASSDQHSRVLTTDVRVGDRKLDSTHPLQSFELDFDDLAAAASPLPLDDAPVAIRAIAWTATDKRYKAALERFLKVKAQKRLKVADDDPSDDFSRESAVTFVEPPASITVDKEAWEGRARRLSSRFSNEPAIRWSQVRLDVRSVNRWLTNSEGTSIQTGRNFVRVFMQATLRADDGADLERHESFDATNLASLPDEATMARAAASIVADLKALQRAPTAEPYVGPAVLEGKAAAVFFHEIFGHRVEGHRQKNDQEGQTFAKKIGEAVMPSFISVYDDPSLERIGEVELNGRYRFDDEGVAARPTSLVDRGVLKGFLMGRSPTRSFARSNGHGRRTEGRNVVARQANLVVQPSLAISPVELRQRLRDEARRQKKAYGLLFKDISGGFTNTERAGPQAFKVLPILVYRVWVDGRPDELVRGADIVGTPLTSLSKIIAASDDYQTFNGYCGAESGYVPVSATSPSLLVQQIEVERKEKGTERLPVLPPPAERTTETGEAVIRQSMHDELARTTSSMHTDDQPGPYFAAYTVNDGEYVQVGATLGSVTSDYHGRLRSLRVDVRVGDPSFDNSNFAGTGFGAWNGGGYASLPLDDDYPAIRRTLWLATDDAYKRAANSLAKKKAAAGGQVADEDSQVPDFAKHAPTTTVSLPTVAAPQSEPLRRIAGQLSSLFLDYPSIATSRATALHIVGQQRYLNSESTWADERDGFVRIDVGAGTQASDGMHVRNTTSFTARSIAELPSETVMAKAVRGMAGELERIAQATIPDGGDAVVLFEGRAAGQIIKRLLADQISGTPPPKVGGGMFTRASRGFAEKIGQNVTAPMLSAYDDPRQDMGPGKQLLLGSYHADDEGVPAQRVSLIEDGVLKAMLMSRTPSKEQGQSNGHARASRNAGMRAHIGNLFITAKGGLSRRALLARLDKESKAKHCAAYVVRLINDPTTIGSYDSADVVEDLSSLYSAGAASVQPMVAYRRKDGKEEPVRGFTIEGLLSKALKDIVAAGAEQHVLSFIDGYGGSGVASAIVTPSLLFTNLEVRRQKAPQRKPPLYPRPSLAR